MATGNPIIGSIRGSIGDVTTAQYNGKTVTKRRARIVANPKSEGQQLQRMVSATVSQFVRAFSPILNNSIQGAGSRIKNLAKIRQLNMNLLRAHALDTEGKYGFNPSGLGFVVPAPFIVSRGTLPSIGITSAVTNGVTLSTSSFGGSESTSVATAFPSMEAGDQITVMVIASTSAAGEAFTSSVAYCRFAFTSSTAQPFVTVDEAERLNPAAIDLTKAEGDWQKLIFAGQQLLVAGLNFGETATSIAAVAIIVSRKEGDLRSNATMFVTQDNVYSQWPDIAPLIARPTYGNVTTVVNLSSERYLDNSFDTVQENQLQINSATLSAGFIPVNTTITFTNSSVILDPPAGEVDGNVTVTIPGLTSDSTVLVERQAGSTANTLTATIPSANTLFLAVSSNGDDVQYIITIVGLGSFTFTF